MAAQTVPIYDELTWSKFQKLDRAQRHIDPARFDTNLLSAAVFHETNRRREQEGLPPLSHHAGARKAAAIQAIIMAERGSISHENPERPRLKTLQNRLSAVGLRPQFAAENVATAFGLQYESGKPFYSRVENGRTLLSYEPNGEPIPKHTYVTFAKALVEGWMQSPGHRKNILSPHPKFLGASCKVGKSDSAIPMFYCAQVFYTP